MKRAWQAAGLLAIALVIAVGVQKTLFARVTTAASDDIFCAGPSGAEACLDSSGNWLPTTDNDTTLGTSSLRWATVESVDINVGDDLSVTDDLTVTDDTTLNGLITLGKTTVGTGQTSLLGIYASTVVPVTASYITVISSAGNILMTSTPNISTTTSVGGTTLLTSGTLLVITSTVTQTVTFQDEGTLTGSFLQLGAATRAVGQYDVLKLIYDATDGFWREVSYTNN